ncbi:hypothetical protein [Streptomyces sp. NPDC055085]
MASSVNADGVRDLAAAVNRSQRKRMDPLFPVTFGSGTISIVNTGLPVTIDVFVDGNPVVTPGVAVLENFTPVVGDTVIIAKQDNQYTALGHLSESDAGWQTLSLGSGFSHNGNSNGNVQYRRVLDHGAWKMQWQGGLAISGSPTNIEGTALASMYRPSAKRSIEVARDVFGGSTMVCQIDFQSDGTLDLITSLSVGNSGGGNDTTSASPFTDSVDPIDSTTTDSGHSHGVTGSHSHTVNAHWHNIQTHTHSVDYPDWISLHKVEYFL